MTDSSRAVFDDLLQQVHDRRARLRLWRDTWSTYDAMHAQTLAPLETEALELKARLVFCFDHACKQKELTKAERQLAAEIGGELAQETLYAAVLDGTPGEFDLERVKAIYRKHGGADFDAEVAAELVQVQTRPAEAPADPATPSAWAAIEALGREGGGEGAPHVEALAAYREALDQALAATERAFVARYGFDPAQTVDPAELMADLEAEIADVKEYIGELEFELSQFVDMQQVKAWLKAMKKQLDADRRRGTRG